MSCLRTLVFVLRESLPVLMIMPYCLKFTPKRKFNSLPYSALERQQKYSIEINFTVDFVSAAAEMEQIVKLMDYIKRTIRSSFCVLHQLYDLLYFCSGRPKISRKVDLQLYDLLYFCSGVTKIDHKVEFP